jgi:hypothetical protein
MVGYVMTAGFAAALAAFQIVRGVDGSASRTDIVVPDLFEPLSIANRLDPVEIDPKLDPMRHRRLKLPQVIAGILFTFAAKVDASFCRTGRHFALRAVTQPLCGAAAVATALFHWPVPLGCSLFEPFGIFSGADEPRAGFTVKAAHSSHLLVRLGICISFFSHGATPRYLLAYVDISCKATRLGDCR